MAGRPVICMGIHMPFDFHNKDRINNLLEEMEELRYRDMVEIERFLWYDDNKEIGSKEPVGDGKAVGQGFCWKGYDTYNWLCTKITIPDCYKGKDVVALFDFGAPKETGNTRHLESLLYLNGSIYQGVDGNHREVFLYPDENGVEFEFKFRLWSGLNGGGRPKEMKMEIKQASYGYLDEYTDHFYFLAKNLLETYEILESNTPNREWILNVLVKAFYYIDFSDTKSEEFYSSVKEAWDYLSNVMKGQDKPEISVTMLGHTHIDVAWLWTIKHSREKAARSFSTVDRMMKRYDNYKFIQSQAQLYDFVKSDYPEVYKTIKKRVSEGKWEPSGAMWVECDCNLASGESIVRQILLGKNFFLDEFGYESEFLWLPDVFGYSWALPQILRKSGVTTFMTTKISWNDTNKLPYDTFMWRGMDGSEVLAHFITAPDMAGSRYYTYNGDSRPYSVKGVWDNYANKDLNKDLLIAYGYGDGGGGPSREMIENINCINKIPDLPYVKTETATSYFRRLHKTVNENEMEGYIPTWDGELYLEFHRGTYTSQSYNKKMNRKMEYGLRDTEILSVIALTKFKKEYPFKVLDRLWKEVLCYQFHDILPGSSIKEVYDDSRKFYTSAEKEIEELKAELYKEILNKEEDRYSIFNSANWQRSTYITLEGKVKAALSNGEKLKSAVFDNKTTIWIPSMKPLSFTVIKKLQEEEEELKILHTDTIQTPYYIVCFDKYGSITRLYDKEAEREILPDKCRGNVLQIFEDKPRCFDAWELEPTIDNKLQLLNKCNQILVRENELGVFVHFEFTYKTSKISQIMCLYNAKKRIDFKTKIIWNERQKLMKAAFPFDIRCTQGVFDIQYGNITRNITRNHSWEAAKFEVVAHKWAAVSETGYGIALLNNCKYGYDVKDNVMRITLLKSPIDPDYTADLGEHEFTYSLFPFEGTWQEAKVEEEAFDLNEPIIPIIGTSKILESFLEFNQDFVELDCMKKEEKGDGIIIRFHEFKGMRGEVQIKTLIPYKSWCECNLMEKAEKEEQEQEISLYIKPYEIKTIKINTNTL